MHPLLKTLLMVLGPVLLAFVCLWLVQAFAEPDFTDTGVGCIDDCLEVAR